MKLYNLLKLLKFFFESRKTISVNDLCTHLCEIDWAVKKVVFKWIYMYVYLRYNNYFTLYKQIDFFYIRE